MTEKEEAKQPISFEKSKRAHQLARKEKKLKDMQAAFKKALPLKKSRKQKRKQP